ncbi:MAG: hypothetical protein N0C84_09815 [Candidatus Thiodiazotropha taylori]|uniref:AbiTii domain-containing protein n=1 Tax=Candidatus Thiodiazotropha taylori TaxID=2792791 RepID=A0A9E4KBV1_9GAMM|nr:hypothetical protein [Candidatus Thiodiazotropha taylori]MCW4256743.1 hypothetical protein [Candidatus Thiodiazotropha taylori]
MNFDKLIEIVPNEPLSKSLPVVLRLAITVDDHDLIKWVKLELNGYFNTNPELTEEVIVPEYRTVAGQHSDDFGRPLVINDADLTFVNTTRLRFGVADLEKFVEENSEYSYRDPNMTEIIKKNMGVEVTTYTFHTGQAAGILAGIKTELIERLMPLKDKVEGSNEKGIISPTEDVIELKPNFFGIGLNLNALGRKWKNYISKKK